MSSSKHSPKQTAAWAKDWGIPGYEMYDPRNRDADRRRKNSSQRKRFNKSMTFKKRGR